VVIGRVEVKGSAQFAVIVAGLDENQAAVNADAQVGSVIVSGDWIASSLASGVLPGLGGGFGDANDIKAAGPG
jgi:hypothetical protein